MKYFENFPKVDYPLEIDGKTYKVSTTDLFIRFKFLDKIIADPFAFYDYLVKDGDRPDTIADTYYGSPEYAWLVMLSNFFSDFQYDFPVPDDVLYQNIETKYNMTIEEASQTLKQYELSDNIVVDVDTYTDTVDDGKIALSIFDFELRQNERKRKIKLLSKKYLNEANKELRDKLTIIKTARQQAR